MLVVVLTNKTMYISSIDNDNNIVLQKIEYVIMVTISFVSVKM